jgi:hypothetical protein
MSLLKPFFNASDSVNRNIPNVPKVVFLMETAGDAERRFLPEVAGACTHLSDTGPEFGPNSIPILPYNFAAKQITAIGIHPASYPPVLHSPESLQYQGRWGHSSLAEDPLVQY